MNTTNPREPQACTETCDKQGSESNDTGTSGRAQCGRTLTYEMETITTQPPYPPSCCTDSKCLGASWLSQQVLVVKIQWTSKPAKLWFKRIWSQIRADMFRGEKTFIHSGFVGYAMRLPNLVLKLIREIFLVNSNKIHQKRQYITVMLLLNWRGFDVVFCGFWTYNQISAHL